MTPRRLKIALCGVAALLGAFASAAPASAAFTLGQASTGGNCGDGYLYYQQAVDSGGPTYNYVAPRAGIITSWAASGSTNGGQMRLLVLRPETNIGPNSFSIAGMDVFRDLPMVQTVVTFTGVRIPIRAGDSIGVQTGLSGGPCIDLNSDPGGDVLGKTTSPAPDPPSGTYDLGFPIVPGLLNARATLEPDADGDGYGDETQDKCPTSAATQGPCTTPSKAKPACKRKKKARKRSAEVAKKKRKCRKKRRRGTRR